MALSKTLCALALFLARSMAVRRTECIVFGATGAAEASSCESLSTISSLPQSRGQTYGANWALEAGDSLALLHSDASAVSLWWGDELTKISLGPLSSPAGASFLDGFLYVACFGTGSGDSGLAVIDVANRRLVSTHQFPLNEVHVHNAYAFEFGGKTEIFVAVLGNPWSSPPLPGLGLVRFDRNRKEFELQTTQGEGLYARSAKQQPDGSIFVLTQNPPGKASTLARLEELNGSLVIAATTQLPQRAHGGAGGADVILGAEQDTVWASDRQANAPGKLHHYRYHPASKTFSKLITRDLGIVPRYTSILSNGDIVSCNEGSNDLSVYPGLAFQPLNTTVSELRVSTISSPMFFLQTNLVSGALLKFV